nr:MAG: capsid protein [Cressdnaviricota sp.]
MTIAETHSTHHERKHHHGTTYRLECPPPEAKWLDTTLLPLTPTTTPTLTNLSLIVQGPGQNQRIGDAIRGDSQFYRMTLARGTVDCFVRVIHFIWKADDMPTAGEILANPALVVSPLNRDYSKTYHVQRDDLYTLANGESQLQVKKEFWDNGRTIKYSADASTAQTMNQVYVLFMSDQAAGATAPALNYYHRFSFMDN